MKRLMILVAVICGFVIMSTLVLHDDKNGQMRQGLRTYNHVEIEVHGKVVDQYGVPISGALITGGVSVNDGFKAGTVLTSNTVTDANGLFGISGYKGKRIGITVAKEGYAFIYTNASLKFSYLWPENERFHPDGTNPVVFRMWKLQGAEPLVSYKLDVRVPCDGSPVHLDLLHGAVAKSAGDLEIVVDMPAASINTLRHTRIDKSCRDFWAWGITISAPSGGLAVCDTPGLVFGCPPSGYATSHQTSYPAGERATWRSGLSAYYYVMFQRGIRIYYGFVRVEAETKTESEGKIRFKIEGYYNPSGSRNLEYDDKLVTPANVEGAQGRTRP